MDELPRVLTRAAALARGFSRRAIDHRLATGRWRRLLPGVYLTVDTATERDMQRAALAFAGTGAVLSGAAALRIEGYERIARPRRLLVLVPPANRCESVGFAQIRRTSRPFEASFAPGPRHAELARAVADHALTLRRLDDARALIAMVGRDDPRLLAGLVVELRHCPRNGSGLFRRALAEVALGAASAPEAEAAAILRATPRIPPFEQNVRIELPGGRWYVADFLWRAIRAVLEIDSVEYHLGPREWRATMDRHLELTTLGYSVVHRPPSALRDRGRFGAEVAAWLTSRTRDQLGLSHTRGWSNPS